MLLASKTRRQQPYIMSRYPKLRVMIYEVPRWNLHAMAEEKVERLPFILTAIMHLHSGIGSLLYPI